MTEDRTPGEQLAPEELDEVAEHLEDRPTDPAPAARPWGPLRFARMSGSSLAGRDAAPWITDFLSAASYRQPVHERDVDDLRLAFSILTTFWYRVAGREAQHAFWGQGNVPRLSMLHQLAERVAA